MKTQIAKPIKKLTLTKTSIRVLTTAQQPAQQYPTPDCYWAPQPDQTSFNCAG